MEYELRGPSAPKGETADFVSTFPMGCPKFHDEDILSTWRLVVETQGPANERSSRSAPRSKSWMLEDTPGHVTHKGQQEGALASNYYVVHRDPDGPGFTAVPVGEWVKFKPCFQVDAPQTLEEAENMMSNRNQSASRITRKLAADAVKLEGVVGKAVAEEDEEDGAAQRRVKAEDGEGEGFDFEEVFDNDDVAMVDEEEEEGGDEHLKPKGIKSADEPDDGELDESGKGMKKILRKQRGESESDSDEEEVKPALATPVSQGDAADDDAEEEEDLDAMAATMPVRQQMTSGAVRTRSPEEDEDEDVPLAKKMKRPTPPPASLVAAAKVKQEKTPPPPAAAAAAPAAAKPAPGGTGLTKEAVIALLKQCKKLQTADLIKKVKESGLAGLKTAEEKTALSSIVKEVARMEEHPPGSGKRYIVLRQKFQ